MGVCHTGSQSIGGFCASLVLIKPHSRSACPVSQINGPVPEGIPHSCGGAGRHPFHYTILTACDNEGLCFFRLTLGTNSLDLVRAAFFAPSLMHLLQPWLSRKKGLLVWVTWDYCKILLVNGEMMDPLNWKILFENFLDSAHTKQLFYLYLWKDHTERRPWKNMVASLRDFFSQRWNYKALFYLHFQKISSKFREELKGSVVIQSLLTTILTG